MQIKTITTAAGANEIDFGNNDPQSTAHFYWFKNLSDSTLYVSAKPNFVAGEDNVAELSAKGAASIETDEGKVYVLGAGKIEIHRTNSKFCPFELPSTGSGGGGENVITLTRAEFDAIAVKDPDTYYVITDDVGETTASVVLNVGADREFTSFTDAMWIAAQITGQKVVINVFAGEYDVYSELGGDDFVAGIGDKKYYEFQPVLSGDVEIHGIGNVTLKLEIPDDIKRAYYNQCNRVSVIHNDRNIIVENITFICKNCRYAIHDECGNNKSAANTNHIIKNCRFYHTNTLCVIGVGCVSPNYKIENCYAENTNGCLFLHDWDVSTGGNLIVSNCIFDSTSNNEMLLSAHSNSTFDVFLSNNNFERLAVNSVDASVYTDNIFRIIGAGNTIPNVTVAEEITNPYPIKLV